MNFEDLKNALKEIESPPPNIQEPRLFNVPCLYIEEDFFKKDTFLLEEVVNMKSLKIPCWNIGSGIIAIKGCQIEDSDPSDWIRSMVKSTDSISNEPFWLELEINNEKLIPGRKHTALVQVLSSSDKEINNPFVLEFEIEGPLEEEANIFIKDDILKNGLNLGKIPYFGEHKFSYKDESANNVEVIGDFSDWEPISMEKQEDEFFLWIPLKDGEYGYRFIVDGEERLDPENPNIEEDESIGVNKLLLKRYKKNLAITNLGKGTLEGEISLSEEDWLNLEEESKKFQITSEQGTKEIVFEIIPTQAIKKETLESQINIESNSSENKIIEIKIFGESSLNDFLPSLSSKKLVDAELDLVKLKQILPFSPFKQKIKKFKSEIESIKKEQTLLNEEEQIRILIKEEEYIDALERLKSLARNFPQKSKEIEKTIDEVIQSAYKQIEGLIIKGDFDLALSTLKSLLTLFPDKKEEIRGKIDNLKK